MSDHEEKDADRIQVSGSGAAPSHGGVAAGAGGIAIGDDVQGGISVRTQKPDEDDKQ